MSVVSGTAVRVWQVRVIRCTRAHGFRLGAEEDDDENEGLE